MSDEECPVSKRTKFDSDVEEHKLRRFDVIDEVQGDGSASDSCGNYWIYRQIYKKSLQITSQIVDDMEGESSDTDIESMLNERLPDELRNKKIEAQYDEKFKIVLEGKDVFQLFFVIESKKSFMF